jgi:hypothetical protein
LEAVSWSGSKFETPRKPVKLRASGPTSMFTVEPFWMTEGFPISNIKGLC